MKEEKIKQVICKILKHIAPETNPSALAPNEDIRKALDIDSFDALNFFILIDQELGVSVPESDYGRLNTLSEITHYLARYRD